MTGTKEVVVRTHGTMITDDVRTPFEPMDMFDLGMDYSTDSEGEEDSINEQDEEGGDSEQMKA
ncbi:hypothetical protein U1Q18_051955 [Sarracenia purpurea var. burkii]